MPRNLEGIPIVFANIDNPEFINTNLTRFDQHIRTCQSCKKDQFFGQGVDPEVVKRKCIIHFVATERV